MPEESILRIDKFLWSVRLFKTRSQATEACKKGKVIIEGVEVKPSRMVKVGEVIYLTKQPVTYTYKIVGMLKSRVGAKLVQNYIEDLTPDEELLKLYISNNLSFYYRDRGAGRPTKKERRLLDKINLGIDNEE